MSDMGDNRVIVSVSGPELYKLKCEAMEFYSHNGVPQKMEEILNSMFYAKPSDVYGYLTTFFSEFAVTPTVSKLKARPVLDSRGQTTLQTDVYCTVRNHEKLIVSSVASSFNIEPEHATQEEKEHEETERLKGVERAIALMQGSLSEALLGQNPVQQAEADTKIMDAFQVLMKEEEDRLAKELAENPDAKPDERVRPGSINSAKKGSRSPKAGKGSKSGPAVVIIPDEPREKMLRGCSAISAISRAVCEAGCLLAEKPLYSYVASLRHGQVPDEFMMPLPMVTILGGGRAFPGKSNCIKEYMVIPKPGMPLTDSIRMISNIYNSISKSMVAKTGGKSAVRLVSDSGALCPTMDKPEAGLEMLQDALSSLDLTAGTDVFFALNCGLQEVFEHEKGKYEVVTGSMKLPDDLVDYWADLVSRYPAIIALIDPIRKQDKEAWMKLCERVSDQCLVVGSAAYHRPGLLKNEELTPDFKTSGIVLTLQQMNNVSDLLQVCKKMEDADNAVIIGSCLGESPDSFVADFAVGCGARFVKLGAPCRGERVAKLNRLVQIEAALSETGRLLEQSAFKFPHLEPPQPPPEETESPDVTAQKPTA